MTTRRPCIVVAMLCCLLRGPGYVGGGESQCRKRSTSDGSLRDSWAARCLLWQGAVDRHGCPRVKVKGRMVTLGRLTYLTFRGPVPKDQ